MINIYFVEVGEEDEPTNKRRRLTRQETEQNDENESACYYQKIKLKMFDASLRKVNSTYQDMISNVSKSVEGRFDEFKESPVFKNLPIVLDVAMFPRNDDMLKQYGDKAVLELKEYYSDLLLQNGCDTNKILSEWNRLKCHIKTYVLGVAKKIDYLEVWQIVWTCDDVCKECKNIMHIIELLLITPFTNAKVERLFSRMNRVKTILRNRLGNQRLETQLRIGEEGCPLSEFKAEDALNYWLNQKVRRMNSAKSRNYPNRSSTATSSTQIVDIATATLSDLEEEEESENEDYDL